MSKAARVANEARAERIVPSLGAFPGRLGRAGTTEQTAVIASEREAIYDRREGLNVPRCSIDHITVTAPSLEAGAAFVREVLGVAPQPGGEHPRMGTHNLLLRLGDALFLEIIAPNPCAPAPARPRWFALDTLRPDSAPALSAWVARTPDIQASASACSEVLGDVEAMSRGALDWLITIPPDGSLPLEGIAPALIQWQTKGHPAAGLEEQGLSLVRLDLCHPDPERVSRLLRSLDLEAPVSVSAAPPGATPKLVAHINTAQGLRSLPVSQPTRIPA